MGHEFRSSSARCFWLGMWWGCSHPCPVWSLAGLARWFWLLTEALSLSPRGPPHRAVQGTSSRKGCFPKKKRPKGTWGKLQCLLEPHLRSHTTSFSWCSWFHSFHSIWRRLPKSIRRQGSLGVLWAAGYQICVLSKRKQIQGPNLKWSHAGGTALHIWCLKYLEC